ncbi:MAG: four helix bundle protein [Candidatus Anammoxibacter sp.]
MEKEFLELEDLSAYKKVFCLGNYVWDIVVKWDYFAKDAVGKQFVKAVDSISANIAEGFGRYHKKDKIKFYRYSFGSLKESYDWNEKSNARNLLLKEQYSHIFNELKDLPREINHLIKFTNDKLKF